MHMQWKYIGRSCPYRYTHTFLAFFGTLCSSMSPRSLNAKSGASAMARFSAWCLPRVDLRPPICFHAGQLLLKPRNHTWSIKCSGHMLVTRQVLLGSRLMADSWTHGPTHGMRGNSPLKAQRWVCESAADEAGQSLTPLEYGEQVQ